MLCFEIDSKYSNSYCGEKIIWTEDGEYLYCQNSNEIIVISVLTCKTIRKINFDEENESKMDSLLTFDISSKNVLVTAHKSGLLMMWTADDLKLIKKWKSNHLSPILNVRFNPSNTIFCSIGADCNIQFWDLINNFPVCVIKEKGIASIISFLPYTSTSTVYVAGHDNIIRCYNYSSKELLSCFKGHTSKITALAFNEERNMMVSASTDQVMIIWNILDTTQLKVVPLFESLQGVFFMVRTELSLEGLNVTNCTDDDIIVVVGSTGKVFVVNCVTYKIIHTLNPEQLQLNEQSCSVCRIIVCPKTKQFSLITEDHKIFFYDYCTFKRKKNVIGCNKEIRDMCFLGDKDQYLALAANDKDIIVYDVLNMNCVTASEHNDKVLTLSAFKHFLLSAGKDQKISIWRLDPDLFSIICVAKCAGHTSTIKSVCSSKHSFDIFASGSEDGVLKLWSSSKKNSTKSNLEQEYKFYLKSSIKAHEKEINCVAFSPNNNIIASGSQDRHVNLWNSQNLSILGTLSGHQRGVRTIRFSPINQILISSSNDCSLRTWSLTTLECLTKIEENSAVLRLEFLAQRSLFVTGSSNGVIKIWKEESTVPVLTLEKHTDSVNALAVNREGVGFYSGGSDPDLIYWKDVTTQKAMEQLEIRNKESRKQEILSNSIKEKQTEATFRLALELNKPLIAYKIISNLIRTKRENLNLNYVLEGDIHILEKHIAYWNTNNRYCKASQLILHSVINNILLNRSQICNYKKFLKCINSYSERHYKRMCHYVKELSFIEFVLDCMS